MDLNCILIGQLDRHPPNQGTKPCMVARLQEVMVRLKFVDAWQELHPAMQEYLCYSPTHGTHSRLDRFLLAGEEVLDVVKASYRVRFLSDHAPLILDCRSEGS